MSGVDHTAISPTCPLRKLFRPSSAPPLRDAPRPSSEPPSDALTEPITPITKDTPMTLVTDLDPLRLMHEQGANLSTMAASLLTASQRDDMIKVFVERGDVIPDCLTRIFPSDV